MKKMTREKYTTIVLTSLENKRVTFDELAACLTDIQRMMFVGHLVDGKSQRKLAQELGVPDSSASVHMRGAMRRAAGYCKLKNMTGGRIDPDMRNYWQRIEKILGQSRAS